MPDVPSEDDESDTSVAMADVCNSVIDLCETSRYGDEGDAPRFGML